MNRNGGGVNVSIFECDFDVVFWKIIWDVYSKRLHLKSNSSSFWLFEWGWCAINLLMLWSWKPIFSFENLDYDNVINYYNHAEDFFFWMINKSYFLVVLFFFFLAVLYDKLAPNWLLFIHFTKLLWQKWPC
jgi:hypothetical protein